ncbi:hypothetical protein BO94DRAFT_569868 [Aspergillus sclerotioniger CBS 115572]|uniref:Cytochrome c oxidase copper chaperone Cox17 n=1 Tax=Aspergillus sclerotioniger CBS 115572 TaxID=1450535 RepID=A0A317V6V2_9EURO|nr:hypothetical protein BO94DRAFT_569868 [Aspergillus sclerotioniger CBS 115572]PWY68562.1 hypothetical protein BO94DRAFT_569868 [Aspergillus sclerotioniger CBS 115572]
MSWLFGSSKGRSTSSPHLATEKAAPAPAESAPAEKPKPRTPSDRLQPCCVCKTEKTARDDCMLFSKTDDPTQECKSMIDQYKACMAGYGFKV